MIVITMVTSDWSWQDRSVRSCDVEPLLLLLLFFKFLFTSNFIVKSESVIVFFFHNDIGRRPSCGTHTVYM